MVRESSGLSRLQMSHILQYIEFDIAATVQYPIFLNSLLVKAVGNKPAPQVPLICDPVYASQQTIKVKSSLFMIQPFRPLNRSSTSRKQIHQGSMKEIQVHLKSLYLDYWRRLCRRQGLNFSERAISHEFNAQLCL